MASLLPSVVRNATSTHTASVIFLHGLGDSGHGWAPVGDQLSSKFPHVKFIFPHAPTQPVTLNGGMRMPSWYDIATLDKIAESEDEKGMLESSRKINKIIQNEIDSGIPSNRIIVGGFSQGCALSLVTALTTEYKLAGLICFSGYLPLRSKILIMASDNSRNTPILWAHGEQDMVVNYQFGVMSKDLLIKAKYNVEFHSFPYMGHSSCPEEIIAMAAFLSRTIPNQV